MSVIEVVDELDSKIKKAKDYASNLTSFFEEMNSYGIKLKNCDSLKGSLIKCQDILDKVENHSIIYLNPKTQEYFSKKIDSSDLDQKSKESAKFRLNSMMEDFSKTNPTAEKAKDFIERLDCGIEVGIELLLTPEPKAAEPEKKTEKEDKGKRKYVRRTEEQLFADMHEAALQAGIYGVEEEFKPSSVMSKMGYVSQYNSLVKKYGGKVKVIKEYNERREVLARKVGFPEKNLEKFVLRIVEKSGDKGVTQDDVVKEVKKHGKVDPSLVERILKENRKKEGLKAKFSEEKHKTLYYINGTICQTEVKHGKSGNEYSFDVTDEHLIVSGIKIDKEPMRIFAEQVIENHSKRCPKKDLVLEYSRLSKYPEIGNDKKKQKQIAHILSNEFIEPILNSEGEFEPEMQKNGIVYRKK